MRKAFARFSHFFQQKYWRIFDINVLNFNETLTNDIISFEHPGPVLVFLFMSCYCSKKDIIFKNICATLLLGNK